MEKLLILDSNSLMNRAFYALPPLTNSEGINTNAIYGFMNMLIKMKEDIKPDYIVATFDRKAPTFRHIEYIEYKAGRKKMPPELFEQFPIIKEILELLGISIYEIDGFEADDIIGTTAKIAEKEGLEVFIVTGDKDALQLATDKTKIVITKKGVSETAIYDEKTFIDEFEVTPTQFIDVKGLMGDKSDNIKGVPGVGEKTAFKLIKTYGSIENVLQNIEEISGKKLKENLENNRQQAIFSKKLATIITEVPIDINLEEIKSNENIDNFKLKKLLLKLDMKSIIPRIINEENNIEEHEDINNIEINTLEETKEIFKNIKDKIFINYATNNESLYSKIELEKIFISSNDSVTTINFKEILLKDKIEAYNTLKIILEDENIKKIIHSSKNLITILSKNNIQLKGLEFDTEIAGYIIDSSKGKYKLKDLIEKHLLITLKEDEELLLKESFYLIEIYKILKEKIEKENMENLFYNIEMPLIFVLSSMEKEGFNIDRQILDSLKAKFKIEIEETQKEIFKLSEEEFNINSPKQLGKILFEKLDLEVIKKTKTGYSTNIDVLQKLEDKHPIISKIIYYRQITKLNSTYVEGLTNVIDEDGFIHSSFNQTVTTTGRLSSTEPNLQNIPIRQEMGREIRKVFIPKEKGDLLLSCDYSQIELRVLAHMSNDENMINAFNNHSDIHRKTAAEVFNVPIDNVTPLMRSRAKAVNFGIIYGIGAFSLSQDLKITKKEAEEYMTVYLDRYPKVKEFLDDVRTEAKENGYVLTLLNRRRFIPEIKSSNKIVKALGERLAMNAPIQGTAADIMKIAMVNVYNRIKKEKLKSTLILQVHDELILNVKKEENTIISTLVREEMERALTLKVKTEVDLSEGTNWYEIK